MVQESQHNNETYRVEKAAFELLNSDAWKLVLFPVIERVIHAEDRMPIMGLDDAFKAAQAQGRAVFARGIVTHIEGLARKFVKK